MSTPIISKLDGTYHSTISREASRNNTMFIKAALLNGSFVSFWMPVTPNIVEGQALVFHNVYAIVGKVSFGRTIESIMAFIIALLEMITSGKTANQINMDFDSRDSVLRKLIYVNQMVYAQSVTIGGVTYNMGNAEQPADSAQMAQAQSLLATLKGTSAAAALGVETQVVTPKPAGKRKSKPQPDVAS